MLLRGVVVVGVVRFVALEVPSSTSSPAAGLRQGALVLLLPVNEVLALGKSESCTRHAKHRAKAHRRLVFVRGTAQYISLVSVLIMQQHSINQFSCV